MRVLAASTAGSGHFAPLVPVLAALDRGGAEILLVVPPGLVAAAEATGHPYRVGGEPAAPELSAIWDRVPSVSRDEAAILVNREIFGRLDTQAMLPAVEAACDDWEPDLVLHEPAEFASAVAAERRDLPHAQVAIGLARVETSSIALAAPVLEGYGSGFVTRLLASPYLTRLPASMDPSTFPTTLRFRESTVNHPGPLPDWWDGDGSVLVFISFGTVAGRLPVGSMVYRAACEAVAGLPVRALLTMGRTRDPAELGDVPANVHVETWVDQQVALGHAGLVVCHGGAGTTFGALAAGVPLVVVPLMADQPTNGRLVYQSGAGLLVETDRAGSPPEAQAGVTAARIRSAIRTVLADPSYATAARRVADEMAAMPALDRVAASLVDWARTGTMQ
ncbi:MAG: hypothetical protein QOI06_3246 [Nocardioidaceae bacterium]|jgi:UDP:flavonoid glycosyltransferase YjiC (YdhE family)|nr:hypothetical protein [Nocardioidaceae bacterium]